MTWMGFVNHGWEPGRHLWWPRTTLRIPVTEMMTWTGPVNHGREPGQHLWRPRTTLRIPVTEMMAWEDVSVPGSETLTWHGYS